MEPLMDMAKVGIDALCKEVHALAIQKGWWDEDRNNAELIALIHSELSEALESLRAGDPSDSHCPQFLSVEVELADAVIRIMDMAAARGYRLGAAICAKHEYNKTRPVRHGGKLF